MISVTIFETSTSYGISLPEYVKTVKQLKIVCWQPPCTAPLQHHDMGVLQWELWALG